MKSLKLVLTAAVIAALAACAKEDKEAPAAPRLSVERATTAQDKVIIHGTAEYGAKLILARDPALDGLPADLVADPITAAFDFEAALEMGDNTFSVIAVDAAGNQSQPGTLKITRVKAAPTGLTLALSKSLVDADTGEVDATAMLSQTEGLKTEGMEVAFKASFADTSANVAAVELSAKADAQGRAHATLKGLTHAGTWVVSAAAKDDARIADEAKLLVSDGAPSTLTLELSGTDSTGTAVKGNSITVVVNTPVTARVTSSDKQMNITGAPFALYTDAPGALVTGDTIQNVLKAKGPPGYRVIAVVQGAQGPLTASGTLIVAPDKAAKVVLPEYNKPLAAGTQVSVKPTVFDKYGNELFDAMTTLSVTPAPATTFTPPGGTVALPQGLAAENFVAYDLSAGTSFTVSADVKNSGTPAISGSTKLTYAPGDGAAFKLIADPAGGTGKVADFVFTSGCAASATKCSTASIPAGTDLSYEYKVVDAYGNDAPTRVRVVTDAPNALVVDDGISGQGRLANLTASSGTAFNLSAYITGVTQPAKMTFFVGTAPAATVGLTLSANFVNTGTKVTAVATVKDRFGNPVVCSQTPGSDITFAAVPQTSTTTAPTPSAVTCNGGIYTTSFTFTTADAYAINATFNAGPVVASGTVSVVDIDSTPPTISLTNLQVNGVACASNTLCSATRRDVVSFTANAKDDRALSQVSWTIFFSTSQTTIGRTVLTSNGPTNTTTFTFSVPNGAFPEDATLVAQATDAQGNTSNSGPVTVRVVFTAFGLGGRTLSPAATGGSLNQITRPEDVAVDSSGNLYVLDANTTTGDTDLVKVSNGSQQVLVSYNSPPQSITVDSSDRVYVAYNNNVDRYTFNNGNMTADALVNLGGGLNTHGVAMLAPTPQRYSTSRGLQLDGTVYEIDAAKAANSPLRAQFKFSTAGTCTDVAGTSTTPPVYCINGPFTDVGDQAAKFAAKVNGLTALRVTVTTAPNAAKTEATYSFAAKATGEQTNNGNNDPVQLKFGATTANMVEGHDEELYVANTGDFNAYRFQSPATVTSVGTANANHGVFSMSDRQWGLAVRDIWTAPTINTFDYLLYILPNSQSGQLWARRVSATVATNGGSSTGAVISSTNAFTVQSAQYPQGTGTTTVNFNNLWDVALSADGKCLAASDAGTGRVYVMNVATATTAPTAFVVADRFVQPHGLAFDAQGNLFIADNRADTVYKLTPASPLPAGQCF